MVNKKIAGEWEELLAAITINHWQGRVITPEDLKSPESVAAKAVLHYTARSGELNQILFPGSYCRRKEIPGCYFDTAFFVLVRYVQYSNVRARESLY